MPYEMKDEILRRLDEVERAQGVRLLYACESGSRAWGFPSADSDYDVRFLYLHPPEWYLSIRERRDVIERPIDQAVDLNGWDLKKALLLFRKSNPPLFEWLASPIVYLERSSVAGKLRGLAASFYSPVRSRWHYLQMARGNVREYLRGDRVKTKKYFYVLRPLLAILWIERGLGPAPTEFGRLVERLVGDPALREAIDALLAAKRAGAELEEGPRIPAISDFIDREIARLEAGRFEGEAPPAPIEPLDDLFREALREAWG